MYQNCNKKGAKKEQFLHTGLDLESMYKIVTILVQKSNKKVPFLIQQAKLSKSIQFCNKKVYKTVHLLRTEIYDEKFLFQKNLDLTFNLKDVIIKSNRI